MITDESIKQLIRAGYNNREIEHRFGRARSSMHSQIRRLRNELGIPSPGRRSTPWAPKQQKEIEANRPEPKREYGLKGLHTYQLSKEELEEIWRKYGRPGEHAEEYDDTGIEADQYLIETAIAIRDDLRRR